MIERGPKLCNPRLFFVDHNGRPSENVNTKFSLGLLEHIINEHICFCAVNFCVPFSHNDWPVHVRA